MITCPACASNAVLTRPKKQIYECEDCEHTWQLSIVAAITIVESQKPKSLKLFLSYGHDQMVTEVRSLKVALEPRGHEVWFDEEQLAGGPMAFTYPLRHVKCGVI